MASAGGDAAADPAFGAGASRKAMPFSTDIKATIAEVSAEGGRKIMIAMDGTEYSAKAAVWTKDNLAKPDDVIILVSVWEEQMVEKLFAELDAELIHPDTDITHSKHQKLHETFDQAICLLSHDKLHGMIVESVARLAPKSIGEELCALATEMSVDIIVCGTRGLGGLKKTFLGWIDSLKEQKIKKLH